MASPRLRAAVRRVHAFSKLAARVSANRQQHAIAPPAAAVAPEELDADDQLRAHRDQAGPASRTV